MNIHELKNMVSEALSALTEYEKTGNSNNNVFNKIRAVGDVCIDNNDLHPFLKNEIDIRSQYDFKSSAFLLRKLYSLSKGYNANKGVRKHLNLIDSTFKKLIDKQNTNTEVVMKNETKINKSNKVFIVHGHDDHVKIETARFIERAGLEAIILHEQPSGSKTIIEKIELFGDVGFAIILYTPCDVGADKSEVHNLLERARQNVVFEHGYFIGRLGRNKVAALVKEPVEIPNDISGIIYTKIDQEGAWKKILLNELKDAGYNINSNALR